MRIYPLAVFFFVAGCLSAPVSKATDDIQWQDVDQLCGQLQLKFPEKRTILVDGRTESRLYSAYLQNATVIVYPAANANKGCCGAKSIATTHSRKYGEFEFKGLAPGYYWLQVQKDAETRVIPVHLNRNFSEKSCSDSSVRRSFVVDSNPPKIETRIR